jgi:hypothetical protein
VCWKKGKDNTLEEGERQYAGRREKQYAGRRGKTLQEARSMAMTRKDFRKWTEDPTLKGKRERCRRRRSGNDKEELQKMHRRHDAERQKGKIKKWQ